MSHVHSSHQQRRAHLLAIASALFVTILWSSSWVLIRLGLDDEELAPVTFAGMRYGLAALVLIASVLVRRTRRDEIRSLDRSSVWQLTLLGVVFYAFTQGAQFVAIDNQPAATTSLVLSLTALFVGIASARSLGERPARRQLGGSALVVLGALVYFAGDLGATTIGLIAALVALGANVGGSLLGRQVNRGQSISPIVVTTVSMTIGAVLLILAGLIVEGPPNVTLRAALIIGWLAIVNTAVAFTLWNLSLRRLSAIESAGINNTMLLQIAALAWWLLDENPGLVGLLGISIVSVGIFLTQLRSPTAARSSQLRLVFATNNPAKREWMTDALLIDRVHLDETVIPNDIDETGPTCEANAVLKALAIGPIRGAVVAAEDSGLFVDALDGFPGTHTSRWMSGTDADRARALLQRCEDVPKGARSARFVSVVALLFPDGRLETHRGELDGALTLGFNGDEEEGYGAIFQVNNQARSAQSNTTVTVGDHRHQALTKATASLTTFLTSLP